LYGDARVYMKLLKNVTKIFSCFFFLFSFFFMTGKLRIISRQGYFVDPLMSSKSQIRAKCSLHPNRVRFRLRRRAWSHEIVCTQKDSNLRLDRDTTKRSKTKVLTIWANPLVIIYTIKNYYNIYILLIGNNVYLDDWLV